MDSESSTNAKSARGAALTFALWIFAIVFIAYPFSAGPARALSLRAKNPTAAADYLAIVYLPLGYAYDHVPPVRAFYDWYLPLWDK